MNHDAGIARHSTDGWTVTCGCGKTFTRSHREDAEFDHGRHVQLEDLRTVIQPKGESR